MHLSAARGPSPADLSGPRELDCLARMDRKYAQTCADDLALRCTNGEGYSRLWHEARHCVAVHLLGRLLRDPIQHRSARLRHDAPGGFDRARRAARLLFRRAWFGGLSRLRIAGHSRLLPGRLRPRAAVSQRAADRMEKGLAPAPAVAVLTRACPYGPLPFPSSICRRWPQGRPARFRCAIRSIWRGSPTAWASPAIGSPSTTTCLRSRAPRPRS